VPSTPEIGPPATHAIDLTFAVMNRFLAAHQELAALLLDQHDNFMVMLMLQLEIMNNALAKSKAPKTSKKKRK